MWGRVRLVPNNSPPPTTFLSWEPLTVFRQQPEPQCQVRAGQPTAEGEGKAWALWGRGHAWQLSTHLGP